MFEDSLSLTSLLIISQLEWYQSLRASSAFLLEDKAFNNGCFFPPYKSSFPVTTYAFPGLALTSKPAWTQIPLLLLKFL